MRGQATAWPDAVTYAIDRRHTLAPFTRYRETDDVAPATRIDSHESPAKRTRRAT